MKLGVFLPNWMPDRTDHQLLVDWARLADDAGFYLLATIDRPNGDTWDPLITLASVAAVTTRIRLGPMILQLPNRNEVLVAKQAATIDRLSNGRFDLGIGAAGRRDDFAVFGARFSDRWRRFPAQIARMRQVWADARAAEIDDAFLGPPPVQDPGPPIWMAATSPETMTKAIEFGDALILSQGTDAIPGTPQLVQWLRDEALRQGKPGFPIGRVFFVAVGDDSEELRREALRNIDRLYNVYTWTGIENMVQVGTPEEIARAVSTLADAGLDLLVFIPAIADLHQVELLADAVLPSYPSWSTAP